MPIKNLSEVRRLPRLGKIHLGVKDESKRGAPTATDYFVCPPEVQQIFGEKPEELRILIPVEDPEYWASQYYRSYSQTRGLICKGDGETAIQATDTETGALADKSTKQVEMREITCDGRECPNYGRQCREVMNLQFLLPEVPGLGVWQIDTSSVNSIRNINSTADLIRAVHGRISMIPLLLTVEPLEVKTEQGGKLKTVYVLNLRTRDTIADMIKARKALPEGAPADVTAVELPTSDDETPDLIIPQNQGPTDDESEAQAETEAADNSKGNLDANSDKGAQQHAFFGTTEEMLGKPSREEEAVQPDQDRLVRFRKAAYAVGWDHNQVSNWLLANVNYGKPWEELTEEQQEQAIADLGKMDQVRGPK